MHSARGKFTPGCAYIAESPCAISYAISDRIGPKEPNTAGMVFVAEMNRFGKRTTSPEWRHVYLTQAGAEFIYGGIENK